MSEQRATSPLLTNIEPIHFHKNGYITIDRRERFLHGSRWKLGINTNPCIQLRKGKRCVYCGFLNYHNPISPLEVGGVFKDVFRNSNLSDVQRLELYVSGSFFDDGEVSFDSRLEIIESINNSEIRETVLESRPEFITEENLKPLTSIINPKRITIAVGVETMDDRLRNELSKDFTTKDIAKSLSIIAKVGMNFQAYLLLNPPAINNDKNAIIDIIESSKKITSLARKMNCHLILAIQPFFIAMNSRVAEDPMQKYSLRPPWLYSVALTLKLLEAINSREKSNLHVILGNENDNVAPLRIPSNYTRDGSVCTCTERIRRYLREINISRKKREESIQKILGSTCSCKSIWEKEVSAHKLVSIL